MTTTADTTTADTTAVARPALIGDSLSLAGRHLKLMSRRPASVIGAIVAPVMFAVLFLTVFSKVMERAGIDYVQYMVPAICMQAVFFSGMSGAIWAAEDASSGMVSRLRSMPVARSAPVLSLLIGETLRALISTLVIFGIGYAAGFRFETGPLGALWFALIIIACAIAVCLPYLVMGYHFADPEPAQAVGGVIYFPFLLISTLFVPASAYPDWLQPIVENQPISRMGDALRAVSSAGIDDVGAKVAVALLWCAGSAVVFGLLTPRVFGRIK